MSVELMLNAANLAFIAFSRQFNQAEGQVYVFFIMTLAAAEAAVGPGDRDRAVPAARNDGRRRHQPDEVVGVDAQPVLADPPDSAGRRGGQRLFGSRLSRARSGSSPARRSRSAFLLSAASVLELSGFPRTERATSRRTVGLVDAAVRIWQVSWGFALDPLSSIMILVVTGWGS
jgi:hypothetical protein